MTFAAMSVLLETSLGEIVIDLYVKECPKTCLYVAISLFLSALALA